MSPISRKIQHAPSGATSQKNFSSSNKNHFVHSAVLTTVKLCLIHLGLAGFDDGKFITDATIFKKFRQYCVVEITDDIEASAGSRGSTVIPKGTQIPVVRMEDTRAKDGELSLVDKTFLSHWTVEETLNFQSTIKQFIAVEVVNNVVNIILYVIKRDAKFIIEDGKRRVDTSVSTDNYIITLDALNNHTRFMNPINNQLSFATKCLEQCMRVSALISVNFPIFWIAKDALAVKMMERDDIGCPKKFDDKTINEAVISHKDVRFVCKFFIVGKSILSKLRDKKEILLKDLLFNICHPKYDFENIFNDATNFERELNELSTEMRGMSSMEMCDATTAVSTAKASGQWANGPSSEVREPITEEQKKKNEEKRRNDAVAEILSQTQISQRNSRKSETSSDEQPKASRKTPIEIVSDGMTDEQCKALCEAKVLIAKSKTPSMTRRRKTKTVDEELDASTLSRTVSIAQPDTPPHVNEKVSDVEEEEEDDLFDASM